MARVAHVSKGAASRALNGRPGVAAETRVRVEAAARELGWVPNQLARALSGARAGTVGWVILRSAKTHSVDPYFMELFAGIELGLADSPTALVVKLVGSIEAEIATYRTWVGEGRVDGVVIMDLRESDPRVEVLRELQLPVVAFVSRGDRYADFGVIFTDEAASTREILDHAYERGHRRVGWISGSDQLETTQVRVQAVADWQVDGDLGVEFVHSDLGAESGADAAERLVVGPARCTFLCLDNDAVTAAVIARLRRLDLRVPDDVSIVTWVDSEMCALSSPTISALSHDILLYGRRLGERLLEVIETGDPGPPELIGPAKLIHRESVSRLATETGLGEG
ncbi:MAG: LacI family DNA-binding transcriptional regulator [Propionibacteriaceae bacterium]